LLHAIRTIRIYRGEFEYVFFTAPVTASINITRTSLSSQTDVSTRRPEEFMMGERQAISD